MVTDVPPSIYFIFIKWKSLIEERKNLLQFTFHGKVITFSSLQPVKIFTRRFLLLIIKQFFFQKTSYFFVVIDLFLSVLLMHFVSDFCLSMFLRALFQGNLCFHSLMARGFVILNYFTFLFSFNSRSVFGLVMLIVQFRCDSVKTLSLCRLSPSLVQILLLLKAGWAWLG